MKYFITGGAGFIGSNFTNHIFNTSENEVTIYDNFLTGKKQHLEANINNPKLKIIEGDVRDTGKLENAMINHDIVYHFAANSDIAAAQKDPGIDFNNGTLLTFNVLEAMRKAGVNRIVFSSGSGVYGDVPSTPILEMYDKMIPISTYGASKLASEGLISSYCFMFNITGTVFRFANVVGQNSTHGVTHDFILRLLQDSSQLKIFGDGQQSKPYIFISDVIKAFMHLEKHQSEGFDVFNVGSSDHLTVKEIADLVCKHMNLNNVKYNFTGGARGWSADVPIYRLDISKIKSIGWVPSKNSKEAVEATIDAILDDVDNGLYKNSNQIN